MMPLFLFAVLFPNPQEEFLLTELGRFPPCLVAYEDFWVANASFLRDQVELYGWRQEQLAELISDSQRIRDAWRALKMARLNPWNETVEMRLGYLRELRFILGETNYRMGWMPPPAPVWRMGWAD